VDRLPVGWDEGPGLVASAWRYRWLVAAVALAGALAGVGVSMVQPVLYEGVSTIHLASAPSGDGGGGQVDPDRYVRNQAAFIVSPPVLERAVRLSKGRVTVKELRKQLAAEPSKESDLVTVRVRDRTAAGAVELADAVGRAYEETAVQQVKDGAARTVRRLQADQARLQEQLKQLDDALRATPGDVALRARRDEVARQYTQVVRRIAEAGLADAGGDPVALREQAELPEEPVQPQPMRLAALGGLAGMVLAAGLAWGLAWRRQPATAGGLQRPAWARRPGLPGRRRAGRRERLARALRSKLPHRGGRGGEAWTEVAPAPDVGSARARARLVTVRRSRQTEGDPGDVTVALAEESEHLNGNGHRPSANGNGSGHWVEVGGEEPDGSNPSALE
jgi:capsular polysaccharide biosynthesis protein